MKLIKPSYKILNQPPGLQGIYEQIELAGRTCYASSHKIQYQENDTCNGSISTTAKDFVDRMINSKHYAMLEHGTVYLKIRKGTYAYSHYVVVCEPDDDFMSSSRELSYRPYTKVSIQDDYIYVTTNYRVLVENGWLNDLKYLCEPTEYHEKRVTVRFITDRGVSHEFVRHRVFSFAQESTRYCNYSKDKFGNELTFIIPSWYNKETDSAVKLKFLDYLTTTEGLYLDLLRGSYWAKKVIEGGATYEKFENIEKVFTPLTPQQARQVLPNALKTELVMTGFISDWKHLFRLRTSFIAETGKPHPDISNLCDPLYKEFIEKGFMTEL